MAKILDLTYEIYEGMDVYPEDPEVKFEITHKIKDKGYKVTKLSLGTHTSTHIDSQSHMHKEGKTLSDYEIGQFVGKAVVARKEKDICSAEVIILDGKLLNSKIVKQIIEIKPKMLGFTADNNLEIEYEREFLKNNILTVGPLRLEKKLPKHFLFCALPLKLRGCDGSPVRAIAIID